MVNRVDKYGLSVDSILVDFIELEAIPGTGVDSLFYVIASATEMLQIQKPRS